MHSESCLFVVCLQRDFFVECFFVVFVSGFSEREFVFGEGICVYKRGRREMLF